VLGLVLDSMWPIKDYILSGALQDWSREFDIVVLIHSKYYEGTEELIRRLGLSIRAHPLGQSEPSSLLQLTYRLQKSLLYERFDISTEKLVQRRTAASALRARSALENQMSRCVRVLAKSPVAGALDRMLAQARRWLTPQDFFSQDLDTLDMDILLVTDPTNRALDPLYYGCLRRGVALAGLVLSWDNLTTKGIIHREYARIMVWNQIMHAELRRMYPEYTGQTGRVVGFPRFDVYRRVPSAGFERAQFLSGLGLDPAKRVILLASANLRFFRNQTQVFRHVCEAKQQGVFPPDVQILIRCHPHEVREEYAELRDFPGVAIWPDASRNERTKLYDQVPDKDELNILAATFRHASVCVAAGSTVMLDAAVCDVPIICIAYDGDSSLPYHDSIASAYEFSHQKPLHEIGATEICRNRAELISAINQALANPATRGDERKKLMHRYVGEVGTAAAKIKEVLLELTLTVAQGRCADVTLPDRDPNR
jgi:hypothetical protein